MPKKEALQRRVLLNSVVTKACEAFGCAANIVDGRDDSVLNAKPRKESKIAPRKIEIPAFELLNDAHRLNIVIERRPVRAHQFVQLFLAGVAKGRMSNVVSERKSFGKICIEAQRFSDRPCNLCDFKRVREPIAK